MSWPLTFCTQSCDVGSFSGLCTKPMKISRDRWRRNEAWSTSEMVGFWSFISLAQSLENGKGIRYDESKDIGLMSVRNMPIVQPVWSTAALWGSGVNREDGQKHLPSFYFIKMKRVAKNQCSERRLCRQRHYIALHCTVLFGGISNIMELLILCMAQISLLKEKNKYIKDSGSMVDV